MPALCQPKDTDVDSDWSHCLYWRSFVGSRAFPDVDGLLAGVVIAAPIVLAIMIGAERNRWKAQISMAAISVDEGRIVTRFASMATENSNEEADMSFMRWQSRIPRAPHSSPLHVLRVKGGGLGRSW